MRSATLSQIGIQIDNLKQKESVAKGGKDFKLADHYREQIDILEKAAKVLSDSIQKQVIPKGKKEPVTTTRDATFLGSPPAKQPVKEAEPEPVEETDPVQEEQIEVPAKKTAKKAAKKAAK